MHTLDAQYSWADDRRWYTGWPTLMIWVVRRAWQPSSTLSHPYSGRRLELQQWEQLLRFSACHRHHLNWAFNQRWTMIMWKCNIKDVWIMMFLCLKWDGRHKGTWWCLVSKLYGQLQKPLTNLGIKNEAYLI